MQRQWKMTSALVGAALALATTSPVLAQKPNTPDRYEGDSTGLTTPNQADNIVEVGPSSGTISVAGMGNGHASSTSNNTMGDVSEGLSNQWINDDDD